MVNPVGEKPWELSSRRSIPCQRPCQYELKSSWSGSKSRWVIIIFRFKFFKGLVLESTIFPQCTIPLCRSCLKINWKTRLSDTPKEMYSGLTTLQFLLWLSETWRLVCQITKWTSTESSRAELQNFLQFITERITLPIRWLQLCLLLLLTQSWEVKS